MTDDDEMTRRAREHMTRLGANSARSEKSTRPPCIGSQAGYHVFVDGGDRRQKEERTP